MQDKTTTKTLSDYKQREHSVHVLITIFQYFSSIYINTDISNIIYIIHICKYIYIIYINNLYERVGVRVGFSVYPISIILAFLRFVYEHSAVSGLTGLFRRILQFPY